MSFAAVQQKLVNLQGFVAQRNVEAAKSVLAELKADILEYESLPPLCLSTANAENEWRLARDTLEQAILVSVIANEKDSFQRHIASLRPFYTHSRRIPDSGIYDTILGLNLLFLLVENRLADFHSELELLTDEQQNHPSILFCTELDQHLMIGSYNQVLQAAAQPPVAEYSYLLSSLLHTVRASIAECASVSYSQLTLASVKELLMFDNDQQAMDYVLAVCPDWTVDESNTVHMHAGAKVAKSQDIPSTKLIFNTLTYATELERIV